MRNPDLQVALLRKLLDDEIRSQRRTSGIQAKLFSDELEAVLSRYRLRHATSAEIVQALVDLAKKMRTARRRHEVLGLDQEEAAFYDALAGSAEDWRADPGLAEIAKQIVRAVKKDLAVDWTTHETREAAVRRNVRRLLRRAKYADLVAQASTVVASAPPVASGGGGVEHGESARPLDRATDLILSQARALYRYWPDVELDPL